MTTKDEALKLALELIEAGHSTVYGTSQAAIVITAIREALAEQPTVKQSLTVEQPAQQQEPVAILHRYPSKCRMTVEYTDEITEVREGSWPLYTTPPQSKPLTDEEIILIVADCASSHQHTDIHFAHAIEAAHGIKENA